MKAGGEGGDSTVEVSVVDGGSDKEGTTYIGEKKGDGRSHRARAPP